MADIHDLIVQHGHEKARDLVPASQRRYVDIASAMLAEEAQAMGVTYSGFCLTGLPHKPLRADEPWVRRGNRVTMMVTPGMEPKNGTAVHIGVPYGARARMVLFYLQTQARMHGSRDVVLGRSMNDWLAKMGMSVGGESVRAIKDQAKRISRCHLTFDWEGTDSSAKGHIQFSIVDGAFEPSTARDPRQGSLWEEVVHLSEGFYTALTEHPVPVRELALRELSSQSMALDVYVWLAYRLHVLSKPTSITWAGLYHQFGGGFAQVKHFKPAFRSAVMAALAAYPEARVEEEDAGLLLFPSTPPIPKLTATAA